MSSSANADDPVTADADKISGTTPNTGCPAFAGHDSEGSCAARPLWYRMPGAGKSVVPIGSRRSSNQTARQGPSRCTCRTCSSILATPCVRVLPKPLSRKATRTKNQARSEWSAGRRRGRGPRHADGCCHPPTLRAWRAPQNNPLARTACFGRAAPPGAPPPSRFSAAAVDRRCASSAPAPRAAGITNRHPCGKREDSHS